jgi:hypothetical protein
MTEDRIWAHCPRCKHTQRFVRAEKNHLFHAGMTVLTLGLWGLSWIALSVGRWIWPWRCKHCSCSTPDLQKKRVRSSSSVLAQTPVSQAPDK